MKSTNFLAVINSLSLKDNKIIIHPNDGYDIGLMTNSYPVKIFSNLSVKEFNILKGDPIDGHLFLENECKQGTIQLNPKFWKKIGKPEKLKLFYNQTNVLLSNDGI